MSQMPPLPRSCKPAGVFALLIVAAIAGCGDKGKTLPPTGGICTMNSMCTAPLVCTTGKCHAECAETRDCPSGQRCVRGATGNICLLPEEKKCSYNTDCAPLVCAKDLQCRNECKTDLDCARNQTCTPTTKVCADKEELDPNTREIAMLGEPMAVRPTDGGTDALDGGTGGTGGAGVPDGGADVAMGGSGGGGAGGAGGTATDAAVTPDMAMPTGAKTYVYAGGGSTIAIFSVDVATGALTPAGSTPVGEAARFAAIDPQSKHAYVLTAVGGMTNVMSLEVQSADGSLKRTGVVPFPIVHGSWYQLGMPPGGGWLLLSGQSNGVDNQVAQIAPDGKLGSPRRLDMNAFVYFTWDPTGKYFYGFSGAIQQYVWDGAMGAITPNTPAQSTLTPGHSATGFKLHPSGKWAYSFASNEIGLFSFETATGTMTEQAYFPMPLPEDPAAWSHIALHPSGNFVYAFGYTANETVVLIDLFSINATTGNLTFVKREKGPVTHQVANTQLQAPNILRDLIIVGGTYMISKHGLAVYRINQTDGTLTSVGPLTDVTFPAGGGAIKFIFNAPTQ